MLYHVIEKQPATSKTRVIKKTNNYKLATKLIEENSNYFIHYNRDALDKINAPTVRASRKVSPMDTFHIRPFPTVSTDEEKQRYYNSTKVD